MVFFIRRFGIFILMRASCFRYAKRRNAKNKVLLHISKSDLRMGL